MVTSLALALLALVPPDAGVEAEDPKRAAARELWAETVAAASKPGADCASVLKYSENTLFENADPPDADVKRDAKAYLWLARCAEKQKFFVFQTSLGIKLSQADPDNPHLELVLRGLLGLGELQGALEGAEKLTAKYPNDADLAVTAAKIHCRARQWARCSSDAARAQALGEKLTGAEGDAITTRAQKYAARAALHLGDVDAAELSTLLLSLYEGEEENADALKKAMVPAKELGLLVEPQYVSHLALGTYHLSGKTPSVPPPVRVYLTNIGADRQVRVSASVQGITATSTKTVTLLKGKEALVELTPPLAPKFKPASVRATTRTELTLKVSVVEGKKEHVAHEDSVAVDVEPRDFLPMTKVIDAEVSEPNNDFLAAWVTPNAKAIDAFLAKAKLRAPKKAFSSGQPSLPQVKALYDELKARGVSYVTDPDVNSGMGFGQRTRLPTEVLASTNAQCLEGALLFASLLEAIDLMPVIVLVPGHAFVGWHTSRGDDQGLPTSEFFLETTVIQSEPFETAVDIGRKSYDRWHKRRAAEEVWLYRMRKKGITPQPFD